MIPFQYSSHASVANCDTVSQPHVCTDYLKHRGVSYLHLKGAISYLLLAIKKLSVTFIRLGSFEEIVGALLFD
jgi:hypothetical protein